MTLRGAKSCTSGVQPATVWLRQSRQSSFRADVPFYNAGVQELTEVFHAFAVRAAPRTAAALILCTLLSSLAQGTDLSTLSSKVWNHGSPDCASNRDPAIEVFRFDPATYILRQNKCLHFEAPFIYVLFGEHTVFIQDTGATADAERFPLYETVRSLITERSAGLPGEELKLLVTHSHGHGDHVAADGQFRGKPGVTLVEPSAQEVRRHFGFENWPEGEAKIDLGGRELIVMPAPGHQEASIAVYDAATGWLLTGDSLYPGRLYVDDWRMYKASVERLVAFAKARPVSAVMGTHIEMSRVPGQQFPAGSSFQPDEAPLALKVEDLMQLDQGLRKAGDDPETIGTDHFVVTPVGALQRMISRIVKFFSRQPR